MDVRVEIDAESSLGGYSVSAIDAHTERMVEWLAEKEWSPQLRSIVDSFERVWKLPGHRTGYVKWWRTLADWAGKPLLGLAGFGVLVVFIRGAQIGWYKLQVKRYIRGKCPTCGYELQGLASPRCPECGVDIEATIDEAARFVPAPLRDQEAD